MMMETGAMEAINFCVKKGESKDLAENLDFIDVGEKLNRNWSMKKMYLFCWPTFTKCLLVAVY